VKLRSIKCMTLALLVCCAGLSPSTGADCRRADPHRRGSCPFSGGVELYGQQAKLGLDLAIKDINAAGGILGRPVEVIYADDGTRPASAVIAMRALIERDGVLAVVGPITSQNLNAIAPLAESPEDAAALRHELRRRQMQPIFFLFQHGSQPGAGPIAALHESDLRRHLFPAGRRPGLASPDVRHRAAPH